MKNYIVKTNVTYIIFIVEKPILKIFPQKWQIYLNPASLTLLQYRICDPPQSEASSSAEDL